jgi:hypothetical protein
MLNTEFTYTCLCTYRLHHHSKHVYIHTYIHTYMTCRPTAQPLMACAEGVVLDHPAPLAERTLTEGRPHMSPLNICCEAMPPWHVPGLATISLCASDQNHVVCESSGDRPVKRGRRPASSIALQHTRVLGDPRQSRGAAIYLLCCSMNSPPAVRRLALFLLMKLHT